MRALTVSLLLGAIALVYYFPQPKVDRPDGILVTDEPRQNPPGNSAAWDYQGYRFTPLASFSIRARVLFKERYWMGREASISPIDLTLGWGLMSDQTVTRQLQMYRGYRRVWWRPRGEFAQARFAQVVSHFANVHLIPSTEALAREAGSVHPGHIVELGGTLVEVTAGDGWHWRSSLSRDDSGDGACEVMWLEWMRVR